MQAWLDKIVLTVKLLLGSPANPTEFWVLLGSSSLIGMVVLHKVADVAGATHAEIGRAILSFVVGMLILVVGITLSGVFVIPELSPPMARWGIPGSALVLSLVLIAPFLCLVHRMNYFSALIVWAVCLVTVYIIISLGGAGFSMAKGVGKDAGAVRERTRAQQEYLDLLGR